MRCYFTRGGHIVDVEVLEGLSDEEAMEKARELFLARADVEGFEVWDRARVIERHPSQTAPRGVMSSRARSLVPEGPGAPPAYPS